MFLLASFAESAPRILAFGDSLTAGYQLPKSESYPAHLEQLLKTNGFAKAQVINAGVSGDTSQDALRRLDWSLKQGRFDLAVVAIGANDGLRQLKVDQFESNLEKIVTKLNASVPIVVLAGMKLPTNFDPSYVAQFQAVYPRIARKTKVGLIPFLLEGVALDPTLNLVDGIHPNAVGQKKVADLVFQNLKPRLEKFRD